MFYPKLAAGRQQTLTTEAFGGYDHNLELADGEFYDMENLSADEYPLLAPRPRRGTAQAIEGVQGILAKDALCWVQNNTLYINGASMEAYMPSVSISAGEKQLISMGAYLCIFPDGIYFNTEKYSDNGYMGQENVVDASSTNVEISLCLVDGTALTVSYKQASQPENPTNGQYWLDTSGKLHTLKQWAEATSQWVSVPTVYLKLSANGIGKGFQQYDGIRLSGLTGNEQVEKLNGSQILYDVGESYIVIVGLVVRVQMEETPIFRMAQEQKKVVKSPLTEVFKKSWKEVIQATFLVAVTYTLFYTLATWSLAWGTKTVEQGGGNLGFSNQEYLLMLMIAVCVFAAFIVISCVNADKFGRKRVIIISSCCLIAFALLFPFLLDPAVVGQRNFATNLLFLCIGFALMGTAFGPIGAFLPELFDANVRYSGSGIGYNLAAIVGAAFVPTIATWLSHHWGVHSVGLYLGVMALCCLIAVLSCKETKNVDFTK